MDRYDFHYQRGGGSFPRRRGDGPCRSRIVPSLSSFPPQARGWTSLGPHIEGDVTVSPAGAGMDLDFTTTMPACQGFPRRRGDGPVPWRIDFACPGFPPQARGWTVSPAAARVPINVSPAGAGMDRPDPGRPELLGRFPRRRGDGPFHWGIGPDVVRFPPQARGWTRDREDLRRQGGVSPAGAGMDLQGRFRSINGHCFPRRRGDGPRQAQGGRGVSAFPPQARGWTRQRGAGLLRAGVSPAGAGMDPLPGVFPGGPGGFPRRRGDGPPTICASIPL